MHWLNLVFDGPQNLHDGLVIVGKTLAVYVFLVAGLRVLGKRELGQMNIYDLVMIVVLGNAVQNAMMNGDNSLGGGVIAASTLLVVNRLFNGLVRRSKRVERLMVGEPRMILNDGVPIKSAMEREGVSLEQLQAAMREHGIEKFEDAHMAILEVDGTISVVPKESGVFRSRRHYRALRLP